MALMVVLDQLVFKVFKAFQVKPAFLVSAGKRVMTG
jgi:hypothetical protein